MDPRLGQLPRPNPVEMMAKQNGKVEDKPSLCPFGCTAHSPTTNQHGYCCHLVGWSTDGRTYERRERVVNTDYEICRGTHPILKDVHVCVEMRSGLRVYHEKGKAPVLIAKPKPEVVEVEIPDEEFEEMELMTRPS